MVGAHTIANANFPMDAEGATYHVGCRSGQIANRILTVGDPARLLRIAPFLDPSPQPFLYTSARGFVTLTGLYRSVPVSVMAIGMGIASMDFFLRESRAVIEGDMAVIRLGSCGSLSDEELKVGDVGVPERVLGITMDYDHWHGGEVEAGQVEPYRFSRPIEGGGDLRDKLIGSLRAGMGEQDRDRVVPIGLHASADCFYGSQGRIDPNFDDANGHLIERLLKERPGTKSLEMETAHLFHLSHIASASRGKISVAAAHMVFAGRTSGAFIAPDVVKRLEPLVGKAALDALVGFKVQNVHPDQGSVWQVTPKAVVSGATEQQIKTNGAATIDA